MGLLGLGAHGVTSIANRSLDGLAVGLGRGRTYCKLPGWRFGDSLFRTFGWDPRASVAKTRKALTLPLLRRVLRYGPVMGAAE